MFGVGDTVLYGSQGVCRIVGTDEKELGDTVVQYYVLKPFGDENSTVFVPLSNKELVSKMRSVMSSDEIHGMIKEMPDEETMWIEDDNQRKQKYHEVLLEGDRKKLVRLIKTLHIREEIQNKKGRRLHQSDEMVLKQAEKLLYGEFAAVLHIKPEEVLPMILAEIETDRKGA